MNGELIGRDKEKNILKDLVRSPKAEFLAVYGRRRVGKTYLIKNFFDSTDCLLFYASGMKGGSLKQQLKNFAKSLGSLWMPGLAIPNDWLDAFETLTRLIEKFSPGKKVVIFLDELPWLVTPKSKCLAAIDYYWNKYWSHNSKVILAVCGSSASWIIKNIINNKGGLYNRVTRKIHLQPFSLKETKQFLKESGCNFTNRHILEIYMATGGVPYYLAQIRSGLSASQNIDHLAFSLQGTLFQDFDILFSSLFDDANDYVQIVKTVAKYQYGILQESLLRECGIPSGGYAVDKLKDLEQAGFLLSFRSCDNKRKGVFYRLIDEYSNFYLKWIDPLKASIQQNVTMSWEQMRASQSWKSWAGYHFETICFKHINQIKTALQLDNSTLVKTWSSRGSKTEKGAQIDLLFDRNDDAITICEIKYTDQPFKIDKSYYQSLQDKINVFRKATKTKKQIFLTFIASSGLKNSIYTEDGIASVVQLDDLFM